MNHHTPLTHPIPFTQPPSTMSLCDFVQQWEQDYQAKVACCRLFDAALMKKLLDTDKKLIQFVKLFVRHFYHVRGHFPDILWFLGNQAPTAAAKQKVLENYGEEFGGDGKSHEQLYYLFAEICGVPDIQESEWLHETHYYPEIKAYNKGHLIWLNQHDWESNFAALSAYEKLDNIDYANLYILAERLISAFLNIANVHEQERLTLKRRALVFFEVHRQADHFDRLVEELQPIYQQHPQKVQDAFLFIGGHQMNMWIEMAERLCRLSAA